MQDMEEHSCASKTDNEITKSPNQSGGNYI